jgi:deazaflavin-dependent oxidoreductase (nitroreductase family)
VAAWNPAARFFFNTHARLYRLTGGVVGGRFSGPVLLLTTTGRKSGQERTVPLGYLRDGDRLVLVGSNGGKDVDPGWVWNLRANPIAVAQIGRRRFWVRAEQASPEEEERLWPRIVAQAPVWGTYRDKTERHVPLVLLRPIPPGVGDRF